jgi:outer membrane protein assembly factor BamA
LRQRQVKYDKSLLHPNNFDWVKIGLAIIIFMYIGKLEAQKEQYLVIKYTDQIYPSPPSKYLDSIAINKYVNEHIMALKAKGHAYVTIDTSYCLRDSCNFLIFVGEKYKIGNIRFTEAQKSVIEASGIKRNQLKGKAIDSITIFTYLKALVDQQNNNGYPFATAGFDSLTFKENELSATLAINKGKMIYFDGIAMEGRLDMKPMFFSRLLDIRKGQLYDHNKVIKSSARIRDLQYVQQRTEPFIRFINDKALLVLTPDPKPASRFDFLIGVLPQVVNGIRKWNITGDFTAELNNTFRKGEYTFVQFKRLKPENLELQLKSTVPFILGLPVGSHLDFRIFKNGLENIDLYFDGGTQYLFGGFNQIKLFGSYRSSRLLEVNTNNIISSGRLPSRLDLTYTGIGVGLNLRQLDYRFNPTKGYSAEITAVLGRKKIIPNRQIVDIPEFANSYDSLKLSTIQGELNANAAYYFRIKNWASIKTEITAGWRYNEQQILTNELMRIGGNRLLRGFDEESILTDFYAFSTAEFRIIFDQNSYLSLPFIDYGVVSTISNNTKEIQPVLGLGMGLNFGTAAGVFNISFAAGKQGTNPLDFSRMKIHFGYVNLF